MKIKFNKINKMSKKLENKIKKNSKLLKIKKNYEMFNILISKNNYFSLNLIKFFFVISILIILNIFFFSINLQKFTLFLSI